MKVLSQRVRPIFRCLLQPLHVFQMRFRCPKAELLLIKSDLLTIENVSKIGIVFIIVSLVLSLIFTVLVPENEDLWEFTSTNVPIKIIPSAETAIVVNWQNFSKDEVNHMSELGRRLLLWVQVPENRTAQVELESRRVDKLFKILVWKHGSILDRRHILWYGKKRHEPFHLCSVNNCQLAYEDGDIQSAHAVVIHMHRTKGPHTLPKWRRPKQIWIMLTDESPEHMFTETDEYTLKDYNGLFNWTMTYRMDSDIPVPYGRTLPLLGDQSRNITKNYANQKSKLASMLISDCAEHNGRLRYVRELQKHIPVDIYGRCGTLNCPGYMLVDCEPLNDYKFYLAFENSNCREYITEKLWWNSFWREAVPVVMGPDKKDYEKMLPPKSFIHVDDFDTPEQLANFLSYLNKNDSEYNEYFRWKKDFEILNEHGYFRTPVFHYCRICEALNYNDPSPKVYEHLEEFWNERKDCHERKWKQSSKD